jgi:A/G-specific adenine glycosylase
MYPRSTASSKNLDSSITLCIAQKSIPKYNGRLPENFNDLLTLPGIGAYTAGAILSIAFNISIPAVDGNVFRIIARINAETGDIQKASVKKRLEACVKELIPSTDAGDFNQALMDLGANICIPNGIPKCEECPVKKFLQGVLGRSCIYSSCKR